MTDMVPLTIAKSEQLYGFPTGARVTSASTRAGMSVVTPDGAARVRRSTLHDRVDQARQRRHQVAAAAALQRHPAASRCDRSCGAFQAAMTNTSRGRSLPVYPIKVTRCHVVE